MEDISVLAFSAVQLPFEWRTSRNIALAAPERFPVEALEKLQNPTRTYAFSALYQRVPPHPRRGEIFKHEWFKNIIDFAPPG